MADLNTHCFVEYTDEAVRIQEFVIETMDSVKEKCESAITTSWAATNAGDMPPGIITYKCTKYTVCKKKGCGHVRAESHGNKH